ncbi:MAG TPA: hypothetical protein VI564_05565 [Candidatus Nanoarchaeia archaeon]|nr:hypothetical protein [Candidatus Nanoarchaeia archaeon]
MKKYIFLMLAVVILGCTQNNLQGKDDGIRDQSSLIVPNQDGSIPVQKDKQGLAQGSGGDSEISTEDQPEGKSPDWVSANKEGHPDWYTCSKDSDCVTAPSECGSSCATNSINSRSYSDYVVEFSKFCEGSSRTIKKCAYTKKSCTGGTCKLEYI